MSDLGSRTLGGRHLLVRYCLGIPVVVELWLLLLILRIRHVWLSRHRRDVVRLLRIVRSREAHRRGRRAFVVESLGRRLIETARSPPTPWQRARLHTNDPCRHHSVERGRGRHGGRLNECLSGLRREQKSEAGGRTNLKVAKQRTKPEQQLNY